MVKLTEDDIIKLRHGIEALDEIELILKNDKNMLGANEKTHIMKEIKVVTSLFVYALEDYELINADCYEYLTGLMYYLLDDIQNNINCQMIQ